MPERKEAPPLAETAPADTREPRSSADLPVPEVEHGHNASPQRHVEPNSDLALHLSREHQHQHLHHSARAEEGRKESVVYSKGTTFEKSTIPDESPQDRELHRRHVAEKSGLHYNDAEQGPITESEEDPQTHPLARYYVHWRIFVHVFIWLLFTGYVALQLRDVSASCPVGFVLHDSSLRVPVKPRLYRGCSLFILADRIIKIH